MKLKSNSWPHHLGALLLFLSGSLAVASPRRTNINPALLYWQAFSLFPEIKGTNVYGMKDDASGLTADWTKRGPTPEDRSFAARYDGAFKLIHRATQMTGDCDWGIDPADGPEAVLPNLVKTRVAIQASVLRARIALEDERQADARDALLDALVMARRIAINGTLVTVMIQAAAEGMLAEFVANHFNRFSPEILQQLAAGFAGPPPRVSVEAGMTTERMFFYDWLVTSIEGFRAAGGDEAAILDRCRTLLARAFDTAEERDSLARRLIKASGGTSAALVAYVQQLEPVYKAMSALAQTGPDQALAQTEAFQAMTSSHSNLLVNLLVPNVGKAHQRELEILGRLAMLRAAIAYRVEGEAGFQRMADPFGQGPFERHQIKKEDGRSGFELRSALSRYGLKGTFFFVEQSN